LAGGGRVAANQLKALPALWRWKEYRLFLDRIDEIAGRADVSPIEFADRQSILLTNPGLGGRLQVTNTMRCAISIYTPGDVAPAHIHSANASRTILSERGGYTNVEGERCEPVRGRSDRHAERHLARSRQRFGHAGHLDRHARLAAHGSARLRLGGH
jgi:gentisate 1,2-dioxygenase